MSAVKYPEITVALLGEDGNAFAILGTVKTAMRRSGVPKEEIDAFMKEAMSGDYSNLLNVVSDYINIA